MNATERMWSGEFGDAYHARDVREVERTVNLFRVMLREASVIRTAVEFGAGTGTNLEALKRLRHCQTIGVEVNAEAACRMEADVSICSAVLDACVPVCKLAFTKGFLIHVDPAELPDVYRRLYEASTAYILLCEYYNPVPVEVEYRGQMGAMWKRDFAGEMLDQFPDLALKDYGFSYDRDPEMPSDNFNWMLLSK